MAGRPPCSWRLKGEPPVPKRQHDGLAFSRGGECPLSLLEVPLLNLRDVLFLSRIVVPSPARQSLG